MLIIVILYFRFPALMRKKVKTFKKIHNIPATENIVGNIFFNIETNIKIDKKIKNLIKLENSMKMGNYYQMCMSYYKIYYLKCNDSFFKNNRMKYRSCTEMSKLMYILKHVCKFDEKFVSMNIYEKFKKKNFKNIV